MVLTDEQVIQKLRSSSEKEQNEALKYLYKQYYTMAVHLLRSNNGDADDAKDVFQDSLIILFNKVRQPDFQSGSSLKTYLYAVCRNLWLKKLRSSGYDQKFRETQDVNAADDPSDALEVSEKQQAIAGLMNKLGEDCRKILLFFYYEKLSMQEIVEKMGLSGEQVAKNKKLNCMNKLREMVLSNSSTVEILRG